MFWEKGWRGGLSSLIRPPRFTRKKGRAPPPAMHEPNFANRTVWVGDNLGSSTPARCEQKELIRWTYS